MRKSIKYKTVEEWTHAKEAHEELKQLRQLKKNLESGIVFEVSPELMSILLTYKTKEL
jgi:hypothetical protein